MGPSPLALHDRPSQARSPEAAAVQKTRTIDHPVQVATDGYPDCVREDPDLVLRHAEPTCRSISSVTNLNAADDRSRS